MPRDFLYYNEEKSGLVWVWALTEDMADGGNEVVSFDGGYYLTYAYVDGDEETGIKRQSLTLKIQMYSNWTYVRGIILWDTLLHHLKL